ncbi:hypothetical protein [Streptomyces sp. NPDC046261]|uniref:LppU/SCO3897 family protein n=1 Tax=Streptomyces sp. NPDC046261 TaxID=3157200 RepID=UPI0033CD1A50
MPTEVTIWLTPEEAASGVTRAVSLPKGTVDVRIPPVQDGTLIRVSTDKGETFIRIRLHGTPPRPPGRGRLAFLGSPVAKPLFIVGVLGVLTVVLLNQGEDSTPPTAGRPSTSTTAPSLGGTAGATAGPDSGTPGSAGPLDSADRSRPPAASDYPATAAPPTPYSAGTCLDGTLPDSTTPVKVKNVDVVSCSSPDAHYRVIQAYHGTTDLSRCREDSETQYSFSSRTTLGGRTISSVVYCLVGIGSYAR